jgi:hypothetical protein
VNLSTSIIFKLSKNVVKKSVFTFGLLASSLVMLSAMPLFNNNAAMAQGYDKYGDSYYSQYPTDDKKYECRTGPFEGFFVSSVEFCKHLKFDDKEDNRKDNRVDNRVDNRTGTQGPPGPAGPQGPQGIQGPPGIVNAELCPPNTDLENVYVLNGTTAESCNFETPPSTGNLSVLKTVTCITSVSTLQPACDAIISGTGLPAGQITPDEFNITVTGNNPNPSQFNGSFPTPVVVTLDPGLYNVIDEGYPSVSEALSAVTAEFQTGSIVGPIVTFSGDCTQILETPRTATGTIAAGESQTCNIQNAFIINAMT